MTGFKNRIVKNRAKKYQICFLLTQTCFTFKEVPIVFPFSENQRTFERELASLISFILIGW